MSITNINFLYGSNDTFENPLSNLSKTNGTIYFSNVDDNNKSYLYFANGKAFLNVVPKLLDVVNGGTGHSSLDSGKALIGNGSASVNLREIKSDYGSVLPVKDTDSLITENTLYYWNGAYDN
jgi:hypothetical protein